MNPATTPGIAPVEPASLPEYAPTPLTDFSVPAHAAAFTQALGEVKKTLGLSVPLVIGGERLQGGSTFESRNPARPAEVVGRFQAGTAAQAAQAVETAHRAFAAWSRVPARERAATLLEAARRMRQRQHTFSAWMVYELEILKARHFRALGFKRFAPEPEEEREEAVEEALSAAVERADYTPFATLLHIVSRPFDDQPAVAAFAEPAPAGHGCYRTFCGT